MAIDLNRFIGTFFDEAQEHLESIEERAMALGANRRDPEILNAIFRAAHSIKGGSGTFGFAQLSEATHEMETLFDALRRGQGHADDATIRLLLDACDAFRDHLGRLREGDRGADPAMEAVRARLAGFRSGKAAPAAVAAAAAVTLPGMRTVVARAAPGSGDTGSTQALKDALAAFGDILAEADQAGEIRVATAQSLEELADALAFALPPGSFELAEARAPGEGERYGLFAEAPPEEKYGLFEPAPPAAAEKYGLFEDAPGAPGGDTTPPAAAAPSPVPPQAPAPEAAAAGEGARARAEQSSIRVSVEKIDRIVNLVGELVVAQAMLQQAAAKATEEDEQLAHSLATLDRNTRDLQQAVMSIRMMPVEFVFSRFPRLVYDLSTQLGKKVELRTLGHETELDKEMIELLVDPLTHVVRNAIDHGIEKPAQRRAAGKPESGTVSMRATHRGGSVVIEVADDGCGLDRERILAKARELGMAASDAMSDAEAWALIFEAGFTTAAEVTQLSGRGVGMDVVRRNIGALGGSVAVNSVRGEGTTITIQLPLTLAVLDGMIVSVGEEQYIIPLEFVAEAFKPDNADVKMVVNQASLVAVRGEHLPIVRLEDVVELPETDFPRPEPLCLVVEIDGRRAALLVDALVGQQQLVVKSLDTNLHSVRGIAGATILGDGRVALILDVGAIIRTGASRGARSPG
ncbi:MAG: chemotaxis protein CheA [Burkholderiales bacterium]